MFGNLTRVQINELLSAQLVGRLGCSDGERMYIIPLSYAFIEESIYIHSYFGKKIEVMRNNSAVCFQADDMRDLSNWKSVIVWGEYEELISQEDQQRAFQLLMARNFPFVTSVTMQLTDQWPFVSENFIPEGVFFRINIKEATGRFEESPSHEYYEG